MWPRAGDAPDPDPLKRRKPGRDSGRQRSMFEVPALSSGPSRPSWRILRIVRAAAASRHSGGVRCATHPA